MYAFFGADGKYHIMDGRSGPMCGVQHANPLAFYKAMCKLKAEGARIDQSVLDAIRKEVLSPKEWLDCFRLRLKNWFTASP